MVFLIVLLMITVFLLVFFNGTSLVPVKANPPNGGLNVMGDISSNNEGANFRVMPEIEPAPEFSFGGGLLALIICFMAFAVFVKRGKLFGKK